MRILAVDTSSEVLGVAVVDEDGREVEFNYSFQLRHASHLVPTIKYLLDFSGLELNAIDAFSVSIGPGSFTGLRIGVAAVKALALVCRKKVVAVPSLDVLARNIPYTEDTICVVVDAKKEKLYARFYKYSSPARSGTLPVRQAGAPYTVINVGANNYSPLQRRTNAVGAVHRTARLFATAPAVLIGYQELLSRLAKIKNDILLVGDGIEKVASLDKKRMKIAGKDFWYPRAINVARIGIEMLKKGKVVKDIDRLVPVYLHPKDVQCKRVG